MHAEDADLAHVGVGDHLEDMRQHMLAGIRLGVEGLGPRRPARPCRTAAGCLRPDSAPATASTCSSSSMPAPVLAETNRIGIRWPSRSAFSNGACSSAGARVGAIFEVVGQQVFVFLDDLVDQLAVGGGDRLEIGIAGIVLEHFDDIRRAMRRQVEQHALLAEALADIGDQAGQIEVVGVDLVDDDHAAQLALGGMAHHALGHQLDAGLGVDRRPARYRRRPARRSPGRRNPGSPGCRPDGHGCLRGRN